MINILYGIVNMLAMWLERHAAAGLVILALVVLLILNSVRKKEARRTLEENRSVWGNVVNTHTGTCPECESKTILSVYESGDIEINCTACDYHRIK